MNLEFNRLYQLQGSSQGVIVKQCKIFKTNCLCDKISAIVNCLNTNFLKIEEVHRLIVFSVSGKEIRISAIEKALTEE